MEDDDGRSWPAKEQLPVVTESIQFAPALNDPSLSPTVVTDPSRLPPVMNDTSRLSPVVTNSVFNDPNRLSPVVTDHLSPIVTNPGRLSPLVGSDPARLSPMQANADQATAPRHLFKKTSPSNQLTLYLPR